MAIFALTQLLGLVVALYNGLTKGAKILDPLKVVLRQ
jgi:hypothetical protein